MSDKLEKRARQLFETGKYSVKEAFEQADKELKSNLPEGFEDLLSALKGKKYGQ